MYFYGIQEDTSATPIDVYICYAGKHFRHTELCIPVVLENTSATPISVYIWNAGKHFRHGPHRFESRFICIYTRYVGKRFRHGCRRFKSRLVYILFKKESPTYLFNPFTQTSWKFGARSSETTVPLPSPCREYVHPCKCLSLLQERVQACCEPFSIKILEVWRPIWENCHVTSSPIQGMYTAMRLVSLIQTKVHELVKPFSINIFEMWRQILEHFHAASFPIQEIYTAM